ncbi:ATP-dependent helicase [Candidatus Uhrbacteria bacterium]|nr:ATP-dependent helicase [Candidatus Uhrbacteria bacterium]
MKEFVLSSKSEAFDPSRCRIDYRAELNTEQLDVVLNGDGPCLVLAGAGSGKTRTITYRVAYLVENGVPPDQILLLTFTNKAAKEMLSRVEGLLAKAGGSGSLPGNVWGGTFHSVANRLLRMYASRVGYSSDFTILDQEDAKDLLKLCVKESGVDPKARRFPSPAALHSLISYQRNAGKTLRDVVERRSAGFFDQLPAIEQIAERYGTRKRASNAMDFDDLLLLLRELLTTHDDMRERLATQFRYVLVDEYQDTNVVQADIVRLLASVHGNLLVVGDDAQSIYSFRAAEIQNILGFPDRFPGARTFRLTTNYRSTPEILHLANAVIRKNASRFEKDLTAVRAPFEKPNLVLAGTAQQEARYIAEQVLALRDAGTPLAEIAVLFRASFLSQPLEFELMKRDVPYDYRGGMKFFERAHVKDVVSHLRAFANPRDEMAWLRVLSLQPGIGAATASRLLEHVRSCGSLEAALAVHVDAGSRAEQGWQCCRVTFEAMRACHPSPADLIRTVVARGYAESLEAEYPDFRDRLDDLEQFAVFAETSPDLKAFLDEVCLAESFGALRSKGAQADGERMVLSTIHQAKGLEWDAVFLMGLTDRAFPHPRALEEEGGIEEERRLFYVASTRARRQLFLTYPVMSGFDTLMVGQPSPFVQELPKGACEHVRLRTAPPSHLSGGSLRVPASSWDGDGGDAVIVLDRLGEVSTKKPPSRPAGGGFLRNVEDL